MSSYYYEIFFLVVVFFYKFLKKTVKYFFISDKTIIFILSYNIYKPFKFKPLLKMKLFTLYHQDNIDSTPVEIETIVTDSFLQAEEKLYSQLQSTAIRYFKCSEITPDTTVYAVFAKGGYIGTNNQKPTFLSLDKEVAKSNAKYRRSKLSKGEKSHFGMGYNTIPLSGKKLIEIFKTVSL